MKMHFAAMIPLTVLIACSSEKEVDLTNASVEEVAAASQKAQKMDPGQWRTSIEIVSIDVPGMPPAQKQMMEQAMGAQKMKNVEQCVTKEQSEKPPAKMFGGDGDCKFDKYQMGGGKINATLTCKPKGIPAGQMQMTMTGTMGGTAYAIDADTKTSGIPGMPAGGGMNMKMKISGQRIGECKA